MTALWDNARGVIRTRAGGWRIGGGVTLQGYDLLGELMDGYSWFEVLLLAITGRVPAPLVASYAEVLWMCVSYPDPRIWCNQATALAATMRASPGAAASVATLSADSLRYAAGASVQTARFLEAAARDAVDLDALLAGRPRDAAGCPQVPGFARPIAKGDDRVPVLRALAESFGLDDGRHVEVAEEIDARLRAGWGEEMNSAAYANAVLLDCGLSCAEIEQFWSMSVLAGALACYGDAVTRPAESFLPQRCDDVDYRGAATRALPAVTARARR